MKKILIALDYAPSAQKVAEAGFQLAQATNARATLLHIILDSSNYSSMYSPVMGYTGLNAADIIEMVDTEKIKKSAQKFLEKSKQHLGSEEIDTIVTEGDYASSIIQVANDIHADLIVMGSHSRSGLEKLLVGSVAENVLRHSTIPLYIIPIKNPSKK